MVPPLPRYYEGLRRPESVPPRFVSFAWRYRSCARRFAPTGCGRPLAVGLDLWSPGAHPGLHCGDLRVLPGSWVTLVCTCHGLLPRGTLDARPFSVKGVAFRSPHDVGSPICSLSRLITTACALAVYASQRGVTPTTRKTRFRWVANPCRVGFGPTGSLRRVSGSTAFLLPPFPGFAWREGRLYGGTLMH